MEVIGVSDLTRIGELALPGVHSNFAISPDGSTLYATTASPNGPNNAVVFIDTKTLAVTQTIPIEAYADPLALSPNGQFLFFGDRIYLGTTASMCALSTTTLTSFCLPVPYNVASVAAAADGMSAYFSVTTIGQVYVLNAESQSVSKIFSMPGPTIFYSAPLYPKIAVTPNGQNLVTLASNAEQIAVTGTVPSTTVTSFAPAEATGSGAYDAQDNLILLPGAGEVDVFDGTSLALKGVVSIPAISSGVAFGGAGYAVRPVSEALSARTKSSSSTQ